MTLSAPTYELTVGSRRWTQHVLGIDVSLRRAPLLDGLRASFPAGADLGASVGDDVTLRLDAGDGGEAVFSGWVTRILTRPHEIVVVATDAGEHLARYRPAAVAFTFPAWPAESGGICNLPLATAPFSCSSAHSAGSSRRNRPCASNRRARKSTESPGFRTTSEGTTWRWAGAPLPAPEPANGALYGSAAVRFLPMA